MLTKTARNRLGRWVSRKDTVRVARNAGRALGRAETYTTAQKMIREAQRSNNAKVAVALVAGAGLAYIGGKLFGER